MSDRQGRHPGHATVAHSRLIAVPGPDSAQGLAYRVCGAGNRAAAAATFHYIAPERPFTLIPSPITLPCTNSCLSSLDSLHRKRYSQCSSRDFPVLFTDPDRCVWPNCYKGGAIYWVSSALSTTYCGRSLTPGITLGTLAGTRVN